MVIILKNLGKKLSKEKVFYISSFKEVVITILETNRRNAFCIPSLYALPEEKFIKNDSYKELPSNEQTLRNHIHHLEKPCQINLDAEHRHVYDHVFDMPPSQQMLIDFREYTLIKKASLFFICLLLRYRRLLCVYCVYAQKFPENNIHICILCASALLFLSNPLIQIIWFNKLSVEC